MALRSTPSPLPWMNTILRPLAARFLLHHTVELAQLHLKHVGIVEPGSVVEATRYVQVDQIGLIDVLAVVAAHTTCLEAARRRDAWNAWHPPDGPESMTTGRCGTSLRVMSIAITGVSNIRCRGSSGV